MDIARVAQVLVRRDAADNGPERIHAHVLATNPERGLSEARRTRHFELDLPHLRYEARVTVHLGQLTGDEVHARTADERGHEQVGGVIVNLGGGSDLTDASALHDHDPIGEAHGLLLVVGHVDGGYLGGQLLGANQLAHRQPLIRVQGPERLVHQVNGGMADDRPRQRHLLLITARKLLGIARKQSGQIHARRHGVDPPADVGRRNPRRTEGEPDVVPHGQMRIQGVELEHHPDIASRRAQHRHVGVVQADRARGRQLEPGDHAQRGGLAAARRSEQYDQLPLFDRQIDPTHGARAIGVGLLQVLERQEAHVLRL